MNKDEILTILRNERGNTVKADDKFEAANRELFNSYNQERYGNEEEGRSQVVASDHFDLVESDMPALTRIFLGANKVMHFKPYSELDTEEAQQKTDISDYYIRQQPDSFKILYDWMKEAGLAKASVLKYFPDEKTKVDYVTYSSISTDELTLLLEDLENEKNVESVSVEKQEELEEETYNVDLKVVRKQKKITIRNVPIESFGITRNATSVQDATLVFDECLKRKGELIADGYDKDLVKNLLPLGMNKDDFERLRGKDAGGWSTRSSEHWTNEEVLIRYNYAMIDEDGDGIPERRLIVECGDKDVEILEDMPYSRAPYAVLTQIPMPHMLIGKSRGEQAARIQKSKTAIERAINDNIYAHSRPRMGVDDSQGSMDGGKVDLDDLMNHAIGGIIRTDGRPQDVLLPIVEPYIGDSALQIVQYLEAKKSNSLGTTLGNQGLDSDRFYKETATRFQGVEKSNYAKIELVARCYAEIGFRELYEGVIWTAQHYQDAKTETMVLGKPLIVDPREWRHEHYAASQVGLGAGDSEEAVQNIAALIQTQMAASQDPRFAGLVDSKRLYNSYGDLVKALGKPDPNEYFVNPEVPQDQIMAMLEQAALQIQQLQQQVQQNPLAEAELIKAQAKMAEVQNKETNSARQFMLKMAQDDKQFAENMALELARLEQDGNQFAADLRKEMLEIELKYRGAQ